MNRIPALTWHAALVLLLITAAGPSIPAAQTSSTLTVRVAGLRSADGNVGVALFATGTGYPEDVSLATVAEVVRIDPKTLTARVTFRDLLPGTYAVSVQHDENGNGRLDKNFLGIPREGYGASNNAARKLRVPAFDAARISLDQASAIEIRPVY